MTISRERTETIETGGMEMVEPTENQRRLDELFERLEQAFPEGYKIEIVEGAIFMTPQRDVHWTTIRRIVRALEDRFGMDVPVMSDVRIDFPGKENGFCPDVLKLADDAKKDRGRWRHQDIEFVAEVISRGTAANDYGPKKTIYAEAGIPVYMIADPYIGRCRVFTHPQDGEYRIDTTLAYGLPIDLTKTIVDLTISTEGFPREAP
ncbi:Uma2 family endonuclease [Streptomyces sp. NPDC058989]|uniref:Uma2 family endonuclease n=1 Tax=Streptomyces sp. NPDC058989 TaxID=3346686 RepID=UPI003692F752